MKKILLLVCILFTCVFSFAQVNISTAEAKNRIDQVVTVCDRVVDAKYLDNSMTKPTLLNLGGVYPNHLLTIVINFEDRKNFSFNPEEFYSNKRVCVTGRLSDFKGKPQIVVLTPAEIKVDESQAGANNPSSSGTTNRAGTANQSGTTSPVTSNSGGNTTNPTGLNNPVNPTSATTTTNQGNTINPSGSSNTGNTNSPTATNRGNTTNPGIPNSPANTTGSTATTNRGNATNTTASNTQTNTSDLSKAPTNTTANNANGSATDTKTLSGYSIEVGPNLRIRSGPGESFGILEVTKAGSEITVLESENGWSHVTYEKESSQQGETITIDGYIKNSVLNSTSPSGATNTTADAKTADKKATSTDSKTINNDANKKTTATYSITISSSLRVRSEPADDSEVLEVIKAGTVVSVIRSQNGWSYVSYKGNASSASSKNQTQNGYIKNSVLK